MVKINITGNFPFQVKVSREGEDDRIFPTYMDANTYPQEIGRFYDGLWQFLQKAAVIDKGDYRSAGLALERLHFTGRVFAASLFGQSRFELQDLFRQIYPKWQTSQMQTGLYVDAMPLILQVSGLGSVHLPFEFLPVFDFEWNMDVRNADDLFRACAKFSGFSAVICRQLFDVPALQADAYCNGVIANTAGLNIRFFNHQGLSFSDREKQDLAVLDNVNIIDPWPANVPNDAAFQNILATQLMNSPDDHIQHLACHADTQSHNVANHSIAVSYPSLDFLRRPRRKNGEISFGSLESFFASGPAKLKNQCYPLIFMNACAAAKISPVGVSSFPKLFHQNGNRGFIAPEIPVPDELAYQFSVLFYGYLVKGEILSFAIHKARKDILRSMNSPLGIIYTIYANPSLRVDRPAITDHLEKRK
ncbi:CHAT domain-containing protein [Mucilaginibacter sp. 22184]|uniref:CHAT domain-containing protein n=1 Tax=Mucilaginibacter sp. 22184 TaxID=3453887 RepID=UPI003F83D149